MLIDWFTVAAQVVNFLILVWLLKRFLYKPILLAIDTREKAVDDRIAGAAATQGQAQKELDDFQHKSAEFDLLRADLLVKAVEDAKVQRQKLVDQAQRDFDFLRSEQQETLAQERESAGRKMAESACREVFETARKTLADLASITLEEAMANVFVQRLRALGGEDKGKLFGTTRKDSPPVAHIRSAFSLPPAQQTAIESAVKDTLNAETEVRFEASPDLVSGIELTMEGCKVSWNVSDYLASLETSNAEMQKDKHAS